MVKDLEVNFGKGSGSQHVPNENGMAPMWKKKSIFWELLPYWEVLDVRHAIDVMHLTKNFCINLIAIDDSNTDIYLNMSGDGIEPPSIQDDVAAEQSVNVHITTILICSDNYIFI